jgi:phenylalanyl-tRNA synthetase beta chain
VGYDRIPATLPVAPPGRGLTRSQRVRRSTANALAAAGLTEVLAYPFVSLDDVALTDGDAPSVAIANPFDSDTGRLRRSLIPGLTRIAHRNIARGLTDLALFEIGTVYLPEAGANYGVADVPTAQQRPEGAVLDELERSIPAQPWYLAALFVGDRRSRGIGQAAEPAGIADALDAAHAVAAVAGAVLRVETGSHPALHPGRTAALWVGDTAVGFAGELLPAHAVERDLPRRVGVLELNLEALMGVGSGEVDAGTIAAFPAATQDLSVVVDESVPAGAVRDAVIEGAGALLESAVLVDDYRGAGLEPGTKSLTLALRFRASDRTLRAAEATEAKLAGLAVASERHGAALRA